MIGSACLICGLEILEFERFMLTDDGVVHVQCPSQGSGEKTSSEVAASTSRSKEGGQ